MDKSRLTAVVPRISGIGLKNNGPNNYDLGRLTVDDWEEFLVRVVPMQTVQHIETIALDYQAREARRIGKRSEYLETFLAERYEQSIKDNPLDAFLLGNYASYLREVVGDVKRSNAFYARALIANPKNIMPRESKYLFLFCFVLFGNDVEFSRIYSVFLLSAVCLLFVVD